ncbi:MAG: zinc ribbon domain-containing protein [Leptolyngbyaceae cyanobacterium RU_5_1]|nr:zinc ribbon domain-containing protein [Leptolyngbyaceae cyanobacterium RU_5_1]
MPDCPKCHQPIDAQAIACPYCRTALKAHGHPGIPLYRAEGQESLCLTCTYHADDTCNFPQRPDAMDCTMYSDRAQSTAVPPGYTPSFRLNVWFKRNFAWIGLAGLILFSLMVALARK